MSSIFAAGDEGIAKTINALGVDYLDAPVSGGELRKVRKPYDHGWRPERAFNAMKPVFEKWART